MTKNLKYARGYEKRKIEWREIGNKEWNKCGESWDDVRERKEQKVIAMLLSLNESERRVIALMISDLGSKEQTQFLFEKMKSFTEAARWAFKGEYAVGSWRCRFGSQESSWEDQHVEKDYLRRRQNRDSNRNRLEKEKFNCRNNYILVVSSRIFFCISVSKSWTKFFLVGNKCKMDLIYVTLREDYVC